MAKIKMRKSQPRIEMTPMVDMFFLLLTFFILTAQFRPQESVTIDTPTSISETTAPENNKITLTITNGDQVFFDVDNGLDTADHQRAAILKEVGGYYNVEFTKQEIEKFELLGSLSTPVTTLKQWIDAEDMAARDEFNTGIPMDSTDNQLFSWIRFSRRVNPNLEVILRGDQDADYDAVKKVIDVLRDNNVRKFNLITTLEAVNVSLDDLNQ